MDKMLVAVFDDEKKAYEGTKALKELHADGSLTIYSAAVIAKDAKGKVTTRDAALEPVGTAFGLATGSLIGLLGGPVGVALGSATGTIAGSMYDLARAGVSGDFLDEVSRSLTPGKTAVVAEVDEEWITPVDTRIEALGGIVFRRGRGEFIETQLERDVEVLETEMKELKAEHKREAGETKAKLQAKVDAAKVRLQAHQKKINDRINSLQSEGEAKINSLQKQAATTRSEIKATIEKRIAETRADNDARNEKLKRAARLLREAAAI